MTDEMTDNFRFSRANMVFLNVNIIYEISQGAVDQSITAPSLYFTVHMKRVYATQPP